MTPTARSRLLCLNISDLRVMALVGRGQVRQVGAPMPQETLDSVKADVQTVSGAVKERAQR
jgi:hypothetical protein